MKRTLSLGQMAETKGHSAQSDNLLKCLIPLNNSPPDVGKTCVERMPKYLEKRGRRWYATLDVPADVRPKFHGTRRFVRSLKTESQSEAEVRSLRLIADWKEQIAAARSGSKSVKPDIVRLGLEWRENLRTVRGKEDEELLAKSLLDDQLWDVDFRDSEGAKLLAKIAYEESYPLDRDIEAWLATQDVEAKTRDMKRSDAQRFADHFRFSDRVSRQTVLSWVQSLQTEKQLKPATVQRILSTCRGYWDYLHITGNVHGAEAVFERVSPKKAVKTKSAAAKKRQAFDASDMPRLLIGALDRDDIELAQLIWLGMWTGCRIEELCSLKVADVHTEHFTVVDAKTSAGERIVPIHPRLAPLMRHLCARSKDGYVLSGLTFNKYGDRSNAIGKRFGRLKAALGYDSRLVFHSIRKTVTTLLENAGVQENVAADIVGHEKKTMTYGVYSKGNLLPALKKAMQTLSYDVDRSIERRLIA